MQQGPDRMNELLGPLRSMGPDEQLKLWKTMLENHPFDLDQLTTLKAAIEERIKVDIISGVPYEIALYIMSFLEPKDLCQATQTCKSWQTVCEDNRLWREKCKEEGLNDKRTLETLFKDRITNTHLKQEKLVTETLPPPETTLNKSEWKVVYLKHLNILRNWRTRKFEISEPCIAPRPARMDPPQQAPTTTTTATTTTTNTNQPSGDSSDKRPLRDTPARRAGNTPAASVNGLLTRSRKRLRLGEMNSSGDSYFLNASSNDTTSGGDISGVGGGNLGDNNTSADDASADTSRLLTDGNDFVDDDNDQTIVNEYFMQLRCHEESVITCLQFNPRTNTIVSGSNDQTLKVWNSDTGRCITTLEGHTGGVWSSQLSPEDIVISGSTDRTLRVWKAHTGELMHTLHGHTSTVRCLALDGDHVVSGSRDQTLRLWDIVEGVCKHVFHGHSAAVRCVEYKNDIIVSGAYDHLVMVWDAKTGHFLHALECHTNRIYSLQFDGKTIASGSLDTKICIWDAATGKLRHILEGHTSLTSKMQLKGNLLVSANADSYCKVWDINTGKCLQTLGGENKHTSAITSVHFNNRYVVTSSDDGTVKLWNIGTGEFIRDLIVLPSASKGGVVWRIRASFTKLICAVGSRTQLEDTHMLILDFNA